MEKVNLEISWGALWRVLFFVLFVAVMFLARQIFFGLFLAIVISSGLEGVVNFLEKRGLPRALSVIAIFVAGIVMVIGVVYLAVPLLIADINIAVTSFNKSIQSFGFGPVLNPEILKSFNGFITRISTSLFSSDSTSPLEALSGFLGGLSLAVSVFVSSFYLSLTKDGVERFIRAVFPADSEEAALRVYDRSKRQIAIWFRTQVILSFVIGILVWGALSVLGVKHALLLAILAGLFEIVPYVGPILAGATAVLAALAVSPGLALTTLIVFLGIQQLENHILVPVLMKRSVGLHPVVVIIALLVGAEIMGFLGILIAVPVAAIFQEVVEDWSSKKRSRSAAS